MRTFSFAAAAFLFAACAAQAEDVADPVPGHPGVTYEMLLRQALPHLKKNDDGSWDSGSIAHFRDLEGKVVQTEDKPPQDLEIAFTSLDVEIVHEDGHRRILVLTDGNSGGTGFDAVLAAFDDTTATPKLLDLADAGRDQDNFVGQDLVPIAAGTDAFVAYSAHTNSSQGYEMATPLTLRGGKFTEIASLFIYNIGTCSYDRRQDVAFSTRDDKGSPYRAFVIRVTTETKPGDGDCGDNQATPKLGKTVTTDTWRWNARKGAFVASSGALDRLSDRNWKEATQ